MGAFSNRPVPTRAQVPLSPGATPFSNPPTAPPVARPAQPAYDAANPQAAFNQAYANGLRGEDLIQTLQKVPGWQNGGAYYGDKDQYGFESFYAAPKEGGGFDLINRTEHGPKGGAARAGSALAMGTGPSINGGGAAMAAGQDALGPPGSQQDNGSGLWRQLLQQAQQDPDQQALRALVGGQ